MKIIYQNIVKVIIGFIFGSILLYFIKDLHFLLISLIQMIFFTTLYTIIDKIIQQIIAFTGGVD